MNLGPYEANNIYCTDCVIGSKNLPNACIDLTVTSPPYDSLRKYSNKDNDVSFDFEELARELFRITKDGGVVVWIVGDQTIQGSESGTSFKQALFFKEVGFKLYDTMIYAKENYLPLSHRRYENQFEYMFVLSKGLPKTFNPLTENCIHAGHTSSGSIRKKAGSKTDDADNLFQKSGNGNPIKETKLRSNIWYYKVGRNMSTKDIIAFGHPATFPEQLAEDHITSWTNEGDLVFDPFMGSGTVAKMATLNRRHFLGFDLSEHYVEEIAKKRMSSLS